MKFLSIAVTMVVCLVSAQDQHPLRAVPDDNLAYPVLITLNNGSTGSGFFLNTSNEIYLVTAKHVLFNLSTGQLLDKTFEILSYSRDVTDHMQMYSQ